VSPHPKKVTPRPTIAASTAVLGARGSGRGVSDARSTPVLKRARSSPPEEHVQPPDHATEALTTALADGKSPPICMFEPRQCAAVSTKWRLTIAPEQEDVPPVTLAVTLTAHGASFVPLVPFQTASADPTKMADDTAATATTYPCERRRR
jgi:hypothetical protein